jgi:threonine dehydrogenase-like Zn-dependent dehydrogenase
VRVPFADVGPSVIPDWMEDEDALLCTDALATAYFGAQLGDIVEGDTVIVFGSPTRRDEEAALESSLGGR